MVLRRSRIALVAAVAPLFNLVTFGNVTAHAANRPFVTHVMSMNTTLRPASDGNGLRR
jgi:predicted small integral membrane protein